MSWREQVEFQRDGDRVRFVKHQQAELEFLIVLAHWNNSPRVESCLTQEKRQTSLRDNFYEKIRVILMLNVFYVKIV
jgi:hypothetical protein